MERNYKVCFVCTGNACRSPFAECVTKDLLDQEGIKDIEVFSLGTLRWGENPRDAKMAEVAERMGYTLTGQTTHMTREQLLKADRIIVFEKHHRNAITKVLDYARWDRIVMFDMLAYGTDTPVEDPHDQTEDVYERVARHIEEGCKRMVGRRVIRGSDEQ